MNPTMEMLQQQVKPSKQRRWQIAQVEKGNCSKCGKRRENYDLTVCNACRERANAKNREKYHARKENHAH